MRTLAHISDLHFGRVDERVVDALAAAVEAASPDLVVVSGDLTQRARTREFLAARAFLERLPEPRLVVPGNHDVPLHDLFSRAVRPLARYRRFIHDETDPFYADDEIAVVGVNTARALAATGGRIGERQVLRSCERLFGDGAARVRVVVTHHPFDAPPTHGKRSLVGGAREAMAAFARHDVDLFLSGHLHVTRTAHTAERYRIRGHSALVVQAGTASSTRLRGESNAWNLVHVERDRIAVTRLDWDDERAGFVARDPERYRREPHGWTPEDLAAAS